MLHHTLFSVSLLAGQALARTITVSNGCNYTVWPALFTNPGITPPDVAMGWEAAAGSIVDLTVAAGWGGRVWGRTECDFSSDSALPSTCATGGCNGGLECDKTSGTGVAPATLAEWTLDADGSDWYDISVVDGFNIPMTLTNTGGGRNSSCSTDLNPGCPEALQVLDSDDEVIGCNSDCAADPTNEAACCSGSQHSTPETCPSSGVEHYQYFKDGCTDGYAYAYDESSESALFKLDSSTEADYTVTFCPS
ncbi:thaumatin [Leucosporidium creatinivorum]|uniref:Thaumatin n=1 Tax=Leucosporidium creatinivorum TaxID=106004 RepID=A0A1Y2EPG1_9BASI|nr:thaumatin [Leucosporidium creatinivorum]